MGVSLGIVLAGAPSNAVLGTLAALLAAAAAIYRPALGLAILAFTYPFDLTTYAGPVKLTTSAALLGILAAVWAARELLPNPPAWRKTPLDLPVLLFGAATILSILGLTGHYDDQLVGLVKAAGGFVVFFIATQAIRDRVDLWLVLSALIATGLIQALQTIVPVISGGVTVSDTTRATGTVIDPNLFAGYLVLLIPIAMALGIAIRQWWGTLAAAIATVIFAGALVATLSRSGWLGLLTASLVLVLLLREQRRQLAIIVGSAIAALLILGLAGPVAARLGPSDNGPWQTLAGRFPIWDVAAREFTHHPIFGIGVNNFQNFYPVSPGEDTINQAHNLFLNIAVERGLIGLAAFTILVVLLFRALGWATGLSRTRFERAAVVGLIASFAGFFAHSLFDVSYYDYKILLLFWLLLAVAASLPRILSNTVWGLVAFQDGQPLRRD